MLWECELMNVNYHLNLSPSSLEIIYRSVDGLRPDPANPRCHSKKQVRQIAESIKAFGFNVPILIDRDGNVVAGTGRLAACGELGMTPGADAVPRSPDPGSTVGFPHRRQPADRDRDLGRPAPRRTAQGPLVAWARFQPRSHRF